MKRTALAVALALAACSPLKSPGAVADKFVDRYYVEFDQSGALPLTGGVARMRLQNEISLVGGSRNGVAPGSLSARVFWKRTALHDDGKSARADYTLQIKPQAGGELGKDAHLELAQQADGTWRVVRFNESTPRQ